MGSAPNIATSFIVHIQLDCFHEIIGLDDPRVADKARTSADELKRFRTDALQQADEKVREYRERLDAKLE